MEKPEVSIHCGDSRSLSAIPDNIIDLVVTSPPYNVGKGYHFYSDNKSLKEHLEILSLVWAECLRVMKPGSRICVNVPHGTGRQPYLPLGAAVTLQLDSLFSMVGTIIWRKNTARLRTSWGSWRRPNSPCLRDMSELIIVARKEGVFEVPDNFLVEDDGVKVSPWLDSDTFLTLTRDIWDMDTSCPAKSGHPAAFPTELPLRLIKLFAFEGATVLDPFAGSGTVGKAAQKLGCRSVLYDIDSEYCRMMDERLLSQPNLAFNEVC